MFGAWADAGGAEGRSAFQPDTGRAPDSPSSQIVIEWQEFRNPDFEVMRRRLAEQVIFDGRNLYETKTPAGYGFTYYSIGHKPGGND